MAEIASLMKTHMITATADETVAAVARRMDTNRVGAVLVVEGEKLTGLFSERDLLRRVIAEGRDPRSTRIGEVATRNVVTVDAAAPLRQVLEVFRESKFRHLPILRDGKPVGILSTRDFLDALVQGFEGYVNDMKYRRELAEGVDPYDYFGGSYSG